MPLYEYRCPDCDARYELLQRFDDPPATTCRECDGGRLEKLISAPAFQFKGSGWYVTDYARKGDGKSDVKADGGDQDGAKSNGDKTDAKTTDKSGDKSADGGKTTSSKDATSASTTSKASSSTGS